MYKIINYVLGKKNKKILFFSIKNSDSVRLVSSFRYYKIFQSYPKRRVR